MLPNDAFFVDVCTKGNLFCSERERLTKDDQTSTEVSEAEKVNKKRLADEELSNVGVKKVRISARRNPNKKPADTVQEIMQNFEDDFETLMQTSAADMEAYCEKMEKSSMQKVKENFDRISKTMQEEADSAKSSLQKRLDALEKDVAAKRKSRHDDFLRQIEEQKDELARVVKGKATERRKKHQEFLDDKKDEWQTKRLEELSNAAEKFKMEMELAVNEMNQYRKEVADLGFDQFVVNEMHKTEFQATTEMITEQLIGAQREVLKKAHVDMMANALDKEQAEWQSKVAAEQLKIKSLKSEIEIRKEDLKFELERTKMEAAEKQKTQEEVLKLQRDQKKKMGELFEQRERLIHASMMVELDQSIVVPVLAEHEQATRDKYDREFTKAIGDVKKQFGPLVGELEKETKTLLAELTGLNGQPGSVNFLSPPPNVFHMGESF